LFFLRGCFHSKDSELFSNFIRIDTQPPLLVQL
jgi:hypothetical protein